MSVRKSNPLPLRNQMTYDCSHCMAWLDQLEDRNVPGSGWYQQTLLCSCLGHGETWGAAGALLVPLCVAYTIKWKPPAATRLPARPFCHPSLPPSHLGGRRYTLWYTFTDFVQ